MSKTHSPAETDAPPPAEQVGRVVSHLKELLFENGLSIPQLAARLGQRDLRPLYALRNNTSATYDFDLLARICALFDGLPLSTLLEYVAPGDEPGARYQQRAVSPSLPDPYGGIRCLIMEHRGDYTTTHYYEQLAQETGFNWTTFSKLANYKLRSVRSATLAVLCWRFGGIDQVFVYDPGFYWDQHGTGANH